MWKYWKILLIGPILVVSPSLVICGLNPFGVSLKHQMEIFGGKTNWP